MNIYIFISILFIVYYLFVIYVFRNLYENHCSCKKLEVFKTSWNYKFVYYTAPLFLVFNTFNFVKYYKILSNIQNGGNLYYYLIIILTLGYGFSFYFDYTLLTLLRIMKENKCPCQYDHRELLQTITYFKTFSNMILYIFLVIKFRPIYYIEKDAKKILLALNKRKK